MTETTVSKRGRPKGTRTATVELETMSFKIPPELRARCWPMPSGRGGLFQM